jgi:glycosyltransferase involved in cell wall biosynthesis
MAIDLMETFVPLVSVVIPTYQHADFVGQAVQSVLEQTCQEIEVIVVNDGSTDRTLEILESFGTRITVITQDNRGLAAARNVGILHSRGEIIAFLDADDVWLPEKLEKQLDLFKKKPGVGLVFSDAWIFDGELTIGKYSQRVVPQAGWVQNKLFEEDFVPMPSVMVRRTCFDQVGLFDETLRSCEDYDMWLRISRVWEIDFVPQPLALYRISPNQMSQNLERMLANQIQVKKKALLDYPELKNLPLSVLDRYFYNLYPRLARYNLKRGDKVACRQNLSAYQRLRGRTLRYWLLTVLCQLPTWFSRMLIVAWDRIHDH